MQRFTTFFSGMFLAGKTCLPIGTLPIDLITALRGCQVG
jgi:hypothetical protein